MCVCFVTDFILVFVFSISIRRGNFTKYIGGVWSPGKSYPFLKNFEKPPENFHLFLWYFFLMEILMCSSTFLLLLENLYVFLYHCWFAWKICVLELSLKKLLLETRNRYFRKKAPMSYTRFFISVF